MLVHRTVWIPVLVALIAISGVAGQEQEPEVRGKKLSEWTQILREDKDARERGRAMIALEIMASKSKMVLPILLREARENTEPAVRARCIELLPKFREQSDKIADTIAAAITEDKSERVRAAAAASAAKLERDGFSTIPPLIEALKDKDATTRLNAAESIGRFSRIDNEVAKEAIPNLIACLDDKDAAVRREAAFVFGRMGAIAEPAVPALAKLVATDASMLVRKEAAKTLGVLGPKAKAAVAGLMKGLQDSDAEMRLQAAMTLGQVGPDAAEAIPSLLKATKDKDKAVRCEAIHSLGKFGKAAYAVIPDLIRILKDEEVPEVRLAAIQELGDFGPEAKQAVEALTIASRDGRPAIREAAAEALKKIQKPSG